jgi:hypothetical protein
LSRSKTEVIFFLTIILYIDTSQSERSDFSRSSKASPFRPPWDSKAASARRGYHSRRRLVLREMEEGMIIALYLAAAVIMAVGSLISPGETGTFANFWQARFSCHRVFYSISISPTFRCLCWRQVLSKHLRSAVPAPSSISSSSCSVSTLASLGSQTLETDASHVRFGAHYGLKSDIAPCPKSANKRLMQCSKVAD